MKKLYKTLLALAAVMTLGAVASAQEVPYYRNPEHGLGYNKYLRTDENGNRFIRIETFATGGGERKAIPADICLVLDNSGSMLYYYVTNTSAYKKVLTQAQVDAPTIPDAEGKTKDPLLVEDDLHDFTGEDDKNTGSHYFHGYDYDRLSTKDFGEKNSITSSYVAFVNKTSGTTISMQNCFRYAKHSDGKYYVIYHKTYKDFLKDVRTDLEESIQLALNAGIKKENIILDPGIGFAKDTRENLVLTNNLEILMGMGYPVLYAASRKRMIGDVLEVEKNEREEGTMALSVYAMMKGAAFVRVHNVKGNVQALKMIEAVRNSKI